MKIKLIDGKPRLYLTEKENKPQWSGCRYFLRGLKGVYEGWVFELVGKGHNIHKGDIFHWVAVHNGMAEIDDFTGTCEECLTHGLDMGGEITMVGGKTLQKMTESYF